MYNRPTNVKFGKATSGGAKPEGLFDAVITRVFYQGQKDISMTAVLGSESSERDIRATAYLGSDQEVTLQPQVFVKVPRLAGNFEYGPLDFIGPIPEPGDHGFITFREGRQDELVVFTRGGVRAEDVGAGSGTDEDAVHLNVADEFSALSLASATSGDFVLIEDADDGYNKKKVNVDDFLSGAGYSQEEIEDFVGAMVSGNTETLITVTYQDNGASPGKLDFVVDNNLANYSNATSQFISDITNEALADLGDVVIAIPADNEVLAYDNGSGDWINQTAAEAGLSAVGHTHTESDITDLDHTDADAFHDNVSGEINALTLVTAAAGDFVVIEDATNSFAKRKVNVSDFFSGITALGDLTDVVITSVGDNEILAYDSGGNWINQTAAEAGLATATHTHTESDITDLDHYNSSDFATDFAAADLANIGTAELADLDDVGVTTPTNRNVLVADGDSWESRALVEADISDLGTYLTDITGEDLNDLNDVVITTPGDNEVLAYDNGSGDWINQTPAEAGLSAVGHDHPIYLLADGTRDLTGRMLMDEGITYEDDVGRFIKYGVLSENTEAGTGGNGAVRIDTNIGMDDVWFEAEIVLYNYSNINNTVRFYVYGYAFSSGLYFSNVGYHILSSTDIDVSLDIGYVTSTEKVVFLIGDAGDTGKWSYTGVVIPWAASHRNAASAGIFDNWSTSLVTSTSDLTFPTTILQKNNYLFGRNAQKVIDASSADIYFYRDNGASVTLQWDESDSRWEFAARPYSVADAALLEVEGHTHLEADITDLDHTDTSAIHDDVAGEINALTQVTAAAGDFLIIEDATNSFAKRKVNADDFLSGAGYTQEEIEDFVGAMVSGNTETLITVTYQDNGAGAGKLDFVVDNDLANYSNTNSQFLTDITGENLADLSDVVITTVGDNEILAYDSGGNWINQTAAEAGLATATHEHTKLVDDESDDRVVVATNGDIYLYNDNAASVTLWWDDSEDFWEFDKELRVQGQVFDTGHLAFGGLVVDSSALASLDGGYGTAIDFTKRGGAAKKAAIAIQQTNVDNDRVDLVFFVSQSGTFADPVVEALRIVGGTTTPNLEVAGGVTVGGDINLVDNDLLSVTSLLGSTGSNLLVRPTNGNDLVVQDGSGDNRIVVGTEDLYFYTGNGASVTLTWDESDDRWEFNRPVTIVDDLTMLALYGTDGPSNYLSFYHDGTNLSGLLGHRYVSNDDFFVRSYRGNLTFLAENTETDTGAIIYFQTDDSVGAAKTRMTIQGTDGDIRFFKDDGATQSLAWDESDDRWEFAARPYSVADAALLEVVGHTHTESDITDLDHTDANAIHDNVAGEINALGLVTAAAGDFVLIEDATNSYAKAKVNVDDFLSGAGYSQEEIEDFVGAMVTGNTETLITVTYQDNGAGAGKLDFVVDNDLANYSNTNSQFLTDITGEDLNDLNDVVVTTPGDNEVLAYNTGTSQWINQTPAEAGLSAVGHTHTESEITDLAHVVTQVQDDDGDVRIDADDGSTGDIKFFADDGTTETLRWSESASEWVISSDLWLGSPGNRIDLAPTTGSSSIGFRYDNIQVGEVGSIGAGSFRVDATSSSSPVLSLRSFSTGANRGVARFQTDDATGTLRTRFDINALTDGDIRFLENDGTTVSLLWDETESRWEFYTPAIGYEGFTSIGPSPSSRFTKYGVLTDNVADGSGIDGAIRINTNIAMDNTWFTIPIWVYNYQTGTRGSLIYVYGYAYAAGMSFPQSGYHIQSSISGLQVRLAYETGDETVSIIIGDETSTGEWSYTGVVVPWASITRGTSDETVLDGWTTSMVTSVADLTFPTGISNENVRVLDDDGVERFVADTDLYFYEDNGASVSLQWSEGASEWRFFRDVALYGADNERSIIIRHDGTNISGRIGHGFPGNDRMEVSSLRGDLHIQAQNSETDTGAHLYIRVDDSTGALVTRADFNGQSGDITFNDDSGVNSLQWDESDSRWEFAARPYSTADGQLLEVEGHTHLEADITDLDHTDADAIHDNVAGEINALTLVTAASGDMILIEDATDTFNKKKVNVDDFLSGAGYTQEEIEDFVGAMVTGNTETLITVTYQDNAGGAGKLDFVVDNDLANYSNTNSQFLTDITGENLADLSDVVVTTPGDNEVLAYDNGSGNWINQTAAEAGLATSGHTHAYDYSDISGNDGATDVTGAELEELSDGSSTTLHTHGEFAERTFVERAAPTTVGDYIEVGDLTHDNTSGATSMLIFLEAYGSGFAQAATYLFAANWDETDTAWVVLAPISDPGAYSGNQVQLEARFDNHIAYLRIVRATGTTAATVGVTILHGDNLTFAGSSGTGTDSSSTYYDHAKLHQATDLMWGTETVLHTGNANLTDLTDVNTATTTNRFVLVADGVDFESRALVEADISDLGTYLENVVEDTTPELGGNLDALGNDILNLGSLQTDVGPDASDYWTLVTGNAGDDFSIGQFDNSGATLIERMTFIGTGTAVTNDGDIQFFNAAGTTETLRWDEDQDEWRYTNKGIAMEDDIYVAFGTDYDLQIYYSSGADTSYITDTSSLTYISNTGQIEVFTNDELLLEGTTAITIDSAALVTIDAVTDVEFYGGGELTLLWDESDDRWEFNKSAVFSDDQRAYFGTDLDTSVHYNSANDSLWLAHGSNTIRLDGLNDDIVITAVADLELGPGGNLRLNFGSPATGDLLYTSNGFGDVARLPIGAAGQVLAVNSGATAPEWVDTPASVDDVLMLAGM